MHVFKATGLRYRINIVSGGEGVYILSGVKEKRQESEISTLVWVFQLLLAGIVGGVNIYGWWTTLSDIFAFISTNFFLLYSGVPHR